MSDTIIRFPGNLATVETKSMLRAVSSYDLDHRTTIIVQGGAEPGDSSGGAYVWIAGSTSADDDQAIIRPSDRGPMQSGRWHSIGTKGAAGNVAIDRTALKLTGIVATVGDIWQLSEGGRSGQFRLTTGAAPADALEGLYLAVTGGAKHWARLWDGYAARPEWWGAVVNSSTTDCKPAIEAALTIAGRVVCGAGDYYCFSTPTGYGNGKRLIGAGSPRDVANDRGTGFVIKSASAHGLVMGLAAAPMSGSSVDFGALALGIEVRDIEFRRDQAPSIASACCAVLIQHTSGAVVEGVDTRENMIGIAVVGTVDTLVSHPHSTRTIAGTGAGTDYFKAVAIQTHPTSPLTSIGGNASVRVEYPIASTPTTLPNTYNIYLDGRFCDTTLVGVATAGVQTPINIEGDALSHGGSKDVRTNSNTVILNPVLDQFGIAGIRIVNLNKFGTVRIGGDDAYFGPLAGATACLLLQNTQGVVSVESGEMAMTVGTTCFGVSGSDVRKLYLGRGLVIHEAGDRAVSLNNLSQSRIECHCNNESRTANQAVIVTGTCAANSYDVQASGKAGGFSLGVALLGAGHTRSTVNVSNIDSTCVSGKLYYNAGLISAAGVFGTTSLATGNFA